MANEAPQTTPWLTIAVAVLAIAVVLGWTFSLKSKQDLATTRIVLLEAQVHALEAKLAAMPATPQPESPIQAPAAQDPAVVAQLNAIHASLAAVADSQQALAAKLAPSVPASATPPKSVDATPAVTAPPPVAPPPAVAKRPVPATLNTLEAAYKQAWDTDQPVIVGQVKDPKTGALSDGRTLDPSSAKSLGVASWQEWYTSAEKTRQATLSDEAQLQRVANQERLVEIPTPPPARP